MPEEQREEEPNKVRFLIWNLTLCRFLLPVVGYGEG